LEDRNHSGPARSIRPGAVNQDNISDRLPGVRLSEPSPIDSRRKNQHHRADQSGSVHVRMLHVCALVEPAVVIKPEQSWPRDWTNVSIHTKVWVGSRGQERASIYSDQHRSNLCRGRNNPRVGIEGSPVTTRKLLVVTIRSFTSNEPLGRSITSATWRPTGNRHYTSPGPSRAAR